MILGADHIGLAACELDGENGGVSRKLYDYIDFNIRVNLYIYT